MAERPKTYKKKQTDGEKLVSTAKERYKRGRDAQAEENRQFKSNMEFCYIPDSQWPDEVARQRRLDGRPVISVNLMANSIDSIVNDWKQNPTQIKVLPADSGADKDTAEIFSGLIRNIETQSNAQQITGLALSYAVGGCKGFMRVVTDYIEGTFEQEIKILPVVNPTSVVYDPDDTSQDGSGWQWCFIEDELSEERFKREYPDEEMESWSGDDTWCSGKEGERKIKIAEYFYKEMKKQNICLLEDGGVVAEDDLQEGMNVVETRETMVPVVHWCILGGNAKEPLKTNEFAGKYIPIVPVWGLQLWINGKRKLFSAMEFSHDAQRLYNYGRSTEAELAAIQNKAPYMVTATQIEGNESAWKAANSANLPYITYTPDPSAPPPMRQGFAQPPGAVLQLAANAAQDIRDTSGIQLASLGVQSNESSGRAINARAAQGDKATFHFRDNVAHAYRYLGMILVDLIAKVIDTPRVVRTLGVDGSEEMKEVNQPTKERDKFGQEISKIYDLGVGRYDVVISTAPAFSSLRQEASIAMRELVQGNPQLMQTHGDIIMKSFDFPNADEFAERSKAMLPPELKPPEDEDGTQLPPEIQMQMQQMQQQMEQMNQLLQQQAQELQSKEAEYAIKMQEIQIKQFDAETKRMQAMQKDNVNLSVEAAPQFNDETDLTEADKLEIEIAAKLHEKDQEREHQIRMAVLNAKLAKGDGMHDCDEMGEEKPSPMALHMAALQEGIAATQANIAGLAGQIAELAAVSAAPKKIIRDANGNIIGSELA